ncbi:protein kinase [Streptomyces sp. NPDC057418]|uniref:serine/threonine-protein kinase n=1 Tax=Streptomyces sp. NPDC057418 TaxID=3346126 RepID=UPI00367C9C8D
MIGPLPPGSRTRIGPYRLLGLLGTGGMGEVYLARADSAPVVPGDPLAGLVALKTVLPGLDLDDGFRIRFRREIAAAGAVRSPHTTALVGGDATGATPWLATEYVPGPSLAEAVSRSGPLPEAVVRAVGARLALALADMHAVRVLHRDLKPGNVLLGTDGPKVIDFGISQAFEATRLTRTGVVVGSPGYISPEHVNGSRALVPASDVFCLGAVLAFAACGRGPFDDPDMAAVVFRIAHAEARLDGVPPGLRPVVERCLAPRPEDRPAPYELTRLLWPGDLPAPFPWHGAVREQLAAHVERTVLCIGPAPAPVRAPASPPRPAVAAATPHGRRRRRGALIAAIVLTLACGVLGAVLVPGMLDRDDRDADAPSAGPGSSADRPVLVPGADAGRTDDFGARGADAAARPAGWKPWTAGGGKTADHGCALAGATLVCSGAGGVTALDAATGVERWNVPEGNSSKGTDGRSIAAVAEGTVYAFLPGRLVGLRLTDGAEVWRRTLPGGRLGTGAVYADGVVHYVSRTRDRSGGRLVAQQVTGKDRREKWSVAYDESSFTLLAAHGRLVAVGGDVQIFDAGSGKRLPGVAARDADCGHPVLEGRELLCVTDDGITVTDTSDPGSRRTLVEGMRRASKPAVSEDGTVVVSAPGQVRAFRLGDGEEIWYGADAYGEDDGGQVSIAGSQAFVAEHGGVTAYDLGGSGESVPVDGKSFGTYTDSRSRLIAAGDVLYLSFDDGTVLSGFAP